jgi:hypothetical protein
MVPCGMLLKVLQLFFVKIHFKPVKMKIKETVLVYRNTQHNQLLQLLFSVHNSICYIQGDAKKMYTLIQFFLFLTHCGRVTQICVFNTVKLGTSASSP